MCAFDMTRDYDTSGLNDLIKKCAEMEREGGNGVFLAKIPTLNLRLARKYLDRSGVVERVEEWLEEDRDKSVHKGGRPSQFPVRAMLVGSLALAMARVPVTYKNLHRLLTSPMKGKRGKKRRRYLGFEVSEDKKTDRQLQRVRRKTDRSTVSRTMKRIVAPFTPVVYPCRNGQTVETLDLIGSGVPKDVAKERQRRADEFAARMLLTVWSMLPKDVRDAFGGDITLDATVIPIFGKRGHNSTLRSDPTSCSPEADAGKHYKQQSARDIVESGGSPPAHEEWTFGFDAHLALTTGEGVGTLFPRLILGISLDRPGRQPGRNAAAILRHILRAGLPAGNLTVDRGYSQQKAENFHLLVRALGYDLVMDYKNTDLGVQMTDDKTGAILVEGTWYGPCMPQDLRDATKTYRLAKLIEFRENRAHAEAMIARGVKNPEPLHAYPTPADTQYWNDVEQRRQYRLEFKNARDSKTNWVFHCPGRAKGSRLGCEHVETYGGPAHLQRGNRSPLPVVALPSNPQSVCTNAATITIDVDKGGRFVQRYAFGSKEWQKHYSPPRSQMEGANRTLKTETGAAIGLPDHRRFRGLGKQLFALTSKIAAANIETVKDFLAKRGQSELTPLDGPVAKRGRKHATVGLEPYELDDDDVYRITGRPPDTKAA